MARYRKKLNKDGTIERIPFTAEEEAARDAEEQARASERPMKKWKADIAATDSTMPRHVEDLIDTLIGLNVVTVDTLHIKLKAYYQQKKAIRGQKPNGG